MSTQKNEQTLNTAAAPLSRRFGAYLIDWYLGGLVTAFPVSVVSMKLYGTVKNQNILSFSGEMGVWAGLAGILAALFYYVVVPALIWNGQTLGKRWLKLKMVSLDGSAVKTGQLMLRQILGIMVIEGGLVTASTLWHQLASLVFHVSLVKPLMYAGMAVSIVSSILVLLGSHRAIHDLIGGTRVVVDK